MISFSLRCASGHEFEAWFRSSSSYDEQCASGDVVCPVCGDPEISKAPMAPAIASRKAMSSKQDAEASEAMRKALDVVNQMREQVEQNCDYVGDDFADEARKIHYGETEERGIYGEASPEETEALDDEGIEVFQLPMVPRRNN